MPGRDIPPFLKQFMEMRQALHKGVAQTLVATAPALKPPSGTSKGLKEDLSQISIQRICESKPPVKELMGYFQKQCDELTKKKMAE